MRLRYRGSKKQWRDMGMGLNNAGTTWVGDNVTRNTPVQLPIPSVGITKIFAGGSTIFLMDDAGKVWASGANASGQLGFGDHNQSQFIYRTIFF